MTKTTTFIAMIAGLTLGTGVAARAQTSSPSRSDSPLFVNVSAGGQFQARTFSTSTTFTLYNETGTVNATQTVGHGFVFDATGGYRFWRRLSGAVGVSTFNGKGQAAATASVPNALFFGQPTIKTFTEADYGDLTQTNVAVNFQLVWMQRVADRLDLAIFGGPSIIHVSQEVASVAETADAPAVVTSESKTTGKAGSVGVDLTYSLNPRYGVGGFVRYLGGQADLPSVSGLSLGGVQVGGGIRFHF